MATLGMLMTTATLWWKIAYDLHAGTDVPAFAYLSAALFLMCAGATAVIESCPGKAK